MRRHLIILIQLLNLASRAPAKAVFAHFMASFILGYVFTEAC